MNANANTDTQCSFCKRAGGDHADDCDREDEARHHDRRKLVEQTWRDAAHVPADFWRVIVAGFGSAGVRAFLDAAPDIVGPWEDASISSARLGVRNSCVAYVVFNGSRPGHGYGWAIYLDSPRYGWSDSMDGAKEEVDRILVAAGKVLE